MFGVRFHRSCSGKVSSASLHTHSVNGVKKVEFIACAAGRCRRAEESYVPNLIVVGHTLVFVETSVTSKAAEAAFEIVDQGSGRVGLFTGGPNARAKVYVMVDWRGIIVRRIGKVGLLEENVKIKGEIATGNGRKRVG